MDIENIEEGGYTSGNGNWWTLALEVEGKDVTAILREHGGTHVLSQNSDFLSAEFSTETVAQTLKLSKGITANGEEDATGLILSWFYTCNPLGSPENQSVTSLLTYGELPTMRGFWVPDDIDHFFGNQANGLGLQPELFCGDVRAVETGNTPDLNVDGNKKRQTSQGKYFTLNMEKYLKYENSQITRGFTVAIKMNFKTLPLTGDSIFMEISSKKLF